MFVYAIFGVVYVLDFPLSAFQQKQLPSWQGCFCEYIYFLTMFLAMLNGFLWCVNFCVTIGWRHIISWSWNLNVTSETPSFYLLYFSTHWIYHNVFEWSWFSIIILAFDEFSSHDKICIVVLIDKYGFTTQACIPDSRIYYKPAHRLLVLSWSQFAPVFHHHATSHLQPSILIYSQFSFTMTGGRWSRDYTRNPEICSVSGYIHSGSVWILSEADYTDMYHCIFGPTFVYFSPVEIS